MLGTTFERRKTELSPEGLKILLKDLSDDPAKQTQWRAFLRKSRLTAPDDFTLVNNATVPFVPGRVDRRREPNATFLVTWRTLAARRRTGPTVGETLTCDRRLRNPFGETGTPDERVGTARQENSRLHALLNQPTAHSPDSGGAADKLTILAETAKLELAVPQKFTLFRSLFRGRDDIYSVRWEGANRKSGYSPASIKDWDALRLVPRSDESVA